MEWFEPMDPILTNTVIQGNGWIHQVKWDGIRGLCYKEDNNIRLYTKSRRERSQWYPEVVGEIMGLISCSQVVLDGELIVPDEKGRPSFHDIMSRDRVKRQERLKHYMKKYPVRYMVFDILFRNGEDLRKLPLSKRTEILHETLKSSYTVRTVENYPDGDALFSLMKEKDMEGIVSKNADSPYIGGKKHKMWYKTKVTKYLTATVCGLKIKENEVKSLVIAEYENGSLKPVGSVSSGLSQKDRATLFAALPQLLQDKDTGAGKNNDGIIPIKPVLNVIVSYIEREQNGSLRHPVLVGFTGEKPGYL